MKKIYIVALVMVIGAIALLTMAADEMTTYSNFAEASKTSSQVKVVGQLSKDKPMVYNPEKDANYFSFYIKDSDGVEKKVVMHQEKPRDFEMSEQIVLTGKMKDGDFFATDMLLKCPSKYKDEEVYINNK